MDADADGFGDVSMCTQDVDMPLGFVNNGEDCDDSDPDAFPGAAPNDDPIACMRDADGDDWGDDAPPPGVDSGSDCDDGSASTFPGAAPNDDPIACMQDVDDDDWGDASPGRGPTGGSDCHDANPDLNPDTLQLVAFTPYNGSPGASRMIQTVDAASATLGPFVTLQEPMGSIPAINVSSATMDANGMILANDLDGPELYTVDYVGSCGLETGTVTGLGSYAAFGSMILPGLEFASNGTLYGISNDDMLYIFDPITGQHIGAIPLTLGGGAFDVNGGGMAYDCAQDRLLFANSSDRSIYGIDPATGEVTLLRDLSMSIVTAWNPTGLAWDPVSRMAYLSTGDELNLVDLDGMGAPTPIGTFSEQVSNLVYLPSCSP